LESDVVSFTEKQVELFTNISGKATVSASFFIHGEFGTAAKSQMPGKRRKQEMGL